jgi:hypothetical protein
LCSGVGECSLALATPTRRIALTRCSWWSWGESTEPLTTGTQRPFCLRLRHRITPEGDQKRLERLRDLITLPTVPQSQRPSKDATWRRSGSSSAAFGGELGCSGPGKR